MIRKLIVENTYARPAFALSSIILYTPCLNWSFGTIKTGPSSTSSHAEPLEFISLSVAAWKMAPATRETGTLGIPARRILTWTGTIPVSSEERGIVRFLVCHVHTKEGYPPAKKGLIHPTRMPFSSKAGWMDLIIPSIACLEALYITPLGIACQDAIKNEHSEY